MIGDGGLRMMGFELATAIRHKLALPVIVLNDGSLNQIRQQQLSEFGAASGTALGPLDLAAFADAVGADYALASSPAELSAAVAMGLASATVSLIEVPVGDTAAIRKGAAKARAKSLVRSALSERTSARLKALIGRG